MLRVKTGPWAGKEFKNYKDPSPHIVMDALEVRPEIKGRWGLKDSNPPKACTCEMLHLAPYKNCNVGCAFCSIESVRGYGWFKHQKGYSVVFENYDEYVRQELEKTNFIHPFDFGADADVFMDLNDKYHLTEKTMRVLNEFHAPYSITTKGLFSKEAIVLMSLSEYSWAQFSMLSLKDNTNAKFITNPAPVKSVEKNIRQLKNRGVKVTVRIQPYIPYVTTYLALFISTLKDWGVDNIVLGTMRFPMSKGKDALNIYPGLMGLSNTDFTKLFTEITPGYWQLPNLRIIQTVELAAKLCNQYGLKFGLCDTYVKGEDGKFISLQSKYGSHRSCECVRCYGFRKVNGVFERIEKCPGTCMSCKKSNCGHREFFDSCQYTIKDYQRLE